MRLMNEDALAEALTRAVREGDVTGLRRLLQAQPALATAEIQRGAMTLGALHLAADWPGYWPAAPEAVEILAGAGADPDAPTAGTGRAETALHWAAASDDVDVARALVRAGADIEAGGGPGGDGTPLEDAVGYGCWHVARFLVAEGAGVDRLWLAAALGLSDRVESLLARVEPGSPAVTEAFWQACHGGQLRVAARLLAAGADPSGRPGYAEDPAIGIAGRLDTRRAALVAWLAELGTEAPQA